MFCFFVSQNQENPQCKITSFVCLLVVHVYFLLMYWMKPSQFFLLFPQKRRYILQRKGHHFKRWTGDIINFDTLKRKSDLYLKSKWRYDDDKRLKEKLTRTTKKSKTKYPNRKKRRNLLFKYRKRVKSDGNVELKYGNIKGPWCYVEPDVMSRVVQKNEGPNRLYGDGW